MNTKSSSHSPLDLSKVLKRTVFSTHNAVKNVQWILVVAFEFTGVARSFKNDFFSGAHCVMKVKNFVLRYLYRL